MSGENLQNWRTLLLFELRGDSFQILEAFKFYLTRVFRVSRNAEIKLNSRKYLIYMAFLDLKNIFFLSGVNTFA